jgi:hypothetical protein
VNIAKKLGEKPDKEASNDDDDLAYEGNDGPEHKQE